MTDAPQILLQHHLKKLRLPTFQGEYAKQTQLSAAENKDHVQYLARLCVIPYLTSRTRGQWHRDGLFARGGKRVFLVDWTVKPLIYPCNVETSHSSRTCRSGRSAQ